VETQSPGTDADRNLFLQTGDTWCLQIQKMHTNPCSSSEKESNLGAFAVHERVSSWRFRGGGKRCIIRRELWSALRTWLWPPLSVACLWPTRGFHQFGGWTFFELMKAWNITERRGVSYVHLWSSYCRPLGSLVRSQVLTRVNVTAQQAAACRRRLIIGVLKDLRWCIRHHSSVVKSAGQTNFGLSAGPWFDSGLRKHQGGVWLGWVRSDETLGTDVVVRSLC